MPNSVTKIAEDAHLSVPDGCECPLRRVQQYRVGSDCESFGLCKHRQEKAVKPELNAFICDNRK
jgi:hypothetical protein